MIYPFYLFLALAPSITWLLFYLRKDAHPESNRQIIKIFFYGMVVAIPAALIELGFSDFLFWFFGKSFFTTILYLFMGVALVEEVLKYLVIKGKVLTNPEFDEPVDVVLYMIIAALGFAALENVLILFSPEIFFSSIKIAVGITIIRFLGATFLHALCSGVVGYFLALAFLETKHRTKLLATGLGIAAALHGLFNYSIMKIGDSLMVYNGQVIIVNSILFIFSLSLLIILLTSLAFFVSFGFKKLKGMASVCKVT